MHDGNYKGYHFNRPECSAYPHENNFVFPPGTDFLLETIEEIELPYYGHIPCYVITFSQINNDDDEWDYDDENEESTGTELEIDIDH